MLKANLQQQQREAVQLTALQQQSQQQKQKLVAFDAAACKLQCAFSGFRARKTFRQRTFARDSDNLFMRRIQAASAIKCAWKCGISRRAYTGLLTKCMGDKANRCARRIQCVLTLPFRTEPNFRLVLVARVRSNALLQECDEVIRHPEVVAAAVCGGEARAAHAGGGWWRRLHRLSVEDACCKEIVQIGPEEARDQMQNIGSFRGAEEH